MALNEHERKIQDIFFQHYWGERNRVENNQTAFAYYTTAETAYNIIKNKEIWMRNIITMNDYKEFEYGRECLKDALELSNEGAGFKASLNGVFPNLFESTYQHFKSWSLGIKHDTYITCFSEHEPHNKLGRLSMWRAYGGSAGIAIVFKSNAFFNITLDGVDLSSVAYLSHERIAAEIEKVTLAVNHNRDFVASLSEEIVSNTLFAMFRFAALCNKHPGFEEEKEWRLVASPLIYPSSNLKQEIEVVKSTPQKVIKLKLQNDPTNHSQEIEFSALMEKIIISPCQFPNIVFQSLVQALSDIGIEDAGHLIEVSDIPYRQPN